MIKHIDIPTQPCHSGVTLTEYAILIALIGVLGLAGLSSLGSNTSNLLKNSSKDMAANNTLSLLAPSKQSSQTKGLTQKYYQMTTEPETGAPELQVSNTASGTGTNVSSADGQQYSSIEMVTAAEIAEMANKETDPETQSYYRKLAELTYWLGGTQGVLDNVKPLVDFANRQIGLRAYTKENALNDLLKYQKKLQALIENPPAEIASEDVGKVRSLVENALAISQTYIDKHRNVLVQRTDGTYYINPAATSNLSISKSHIAKNGQLTQAQLKRAQDREKVLKQLFKRERRITDRSYGTFAKLPEMEKVAEKVVNSKSVKSTSVKTTLKTGAALAEQATSIPTNTTEAKPAATAPKSTSTTTTAKKAKT